MDVSNQLHSPVALPQGKSPSTHRIGEWVGPRAGLDAVVERKNFLALAGTQTSDHPARSPALYQSNEIWARSDVQVLPAHCAFILWLLCNEFMGLQVFGLTEECLKPLEEDKFIQSHVSSVKTLKTRLNFKCMCRRWFDNKRKAWIVILVSFGLRFACLVSDSTERISTKLDIEGLHHKLSTKFNSDSYCFDSSRGRLGRDVV
jgi:hypothetical protein